MTPDTVASLINLGAAGAVILVVLIFIDYIKKKEQQSIEDNKQRDKDWRDFFVTIHATDGDAIKGMASAISTLIDSVNCLSDKLNAHDTNVADRIKAIQLASKRSPRV
jgi:hypothetical protein